MLLRGGVCMPCLRAVRAIPAGDTSHRIHNGVDIYRFSYYIPPS